MEKVYSSKWLSGRSLELSSGQILANPHTDQDCSDRHCPIHNPSDHPYTELPLKFNGRHMVRLDSTVEAGFRIDPDDYNYNSNGMAILRNSALCTKCWSDVVSNHRHDYVTCECGNVSVDGGDSYTKRSVRDSEYFHDTSIVVYHPDHNEDDDD